MEPPLISRQEGKSQIFDFQAGVLNPSEMVASWEGSVRSAEAAQEHTKGAGYHIPLLLWDKHIPSHYYCGISTSHPITALIQGSKDSWCPLKMSQIKWSFWGFFRPYLTDNAFRDWGVFCFFIAMCQSDASHSLETVEEVWRNECVNPVCWVGWGLCGGTAPAPPAHRAHHPSLLL